MLLTQSVEGRSCSEKRRKNFLRGDMPPCRERRNIDLKSQFFIKFFFFTHKLLVTLLTGEPSGKEFLLKCQAWLVTSAKVEEATTNTYPLENHSYSKLVNLELVKWSWNWFHISCISIFFVNTSGHKDILKDILEAVSEKSSKTTCMYWY